MHGGKLSLGQVQAWALNRYCYQAAIPRKDATLISKIHDRELRRVWAQRIIDHDGREQEEGGIERWLVLTDGLGLPRDYVISREGRAAGHGVCRGSLCALCRRTAASGGGVVLPDRAVCPGDSQRAHRRHAGKLRLYRRPRAGLLPPPLDQAPRDADFALDYVSATR